ncbi:MAG: hypothetical protein Q7R68_10915 [Nitrospirales bacterium]|nr:hypothetical protein [Nitrospirales bacterium]
MKNTPEQEKAAIAESGRRSAAARAPKKPPACPPHIWFRQTGQADPEGTVVLKCHGSCAGTTTIDLATWDAASGAGLVEPAQAAKARAHIDAKLGLAVVGGK